jgi:Rrf2 family nitric oxide-sensitive transcriptional repressor
MRLADYTDYSLRVLMYCATYPDRRITIADLADDLKLSRNHLMKIVNDLARRGLVTTTRGRGGGLRLAGDPRDIRVGDIVRASESDFRLVECFGEGLTSCTLESACRLKSIFAAALQAYFESLDQYTLADLVPAGFGGPRGVVAKGEPAVVRIERRPARGELAGQR